MAMTTYQSGGSLFHFGDLVVAEVCFAPDEDRVGRLLQVRVGVGAFGSDMFLIRARSGKMAWFHNVRLRRADDHAFVEAFAMFWRPDGAGYTCDLNDAGLYEKTEGRRDTDIYVPIEVARSMSVTHVRVEPLKRAGYWSKPQPKDTRPQRCEGCSRFVKRGGWLCDKCAEKGW